MNREELKAKQTELQKQLAKIEAELVKPDKWEPQGGEWFVHSNGTVHYCESHDTTRIAGVEYPAKELAEYVADQMRQHNRLLAYVLEHAPDWRAVWDGEQQNWFVYYDEEYNKWDCAYGLSTRGVERIYMPEHVAKQLVDDLNSGRVVL